MRATDVKFVSFFLSFFLRRLDACRPTILQCGPADSHGAHGKASPKGNAYAHRRTADHIF